jgi:hypothetical protein
VALLGTRLYLALDASAVTAVALAEGVRGRQLRQLAREPLAPGELAPGASGRNLHDTEAVRAALRRALASVGRGRVTLVLPDGVARLALVETPASVDTREYVRYRLASSLPWSAAEAMVETLAAGPGRVVGAAVHRATVAEYEQAATAAGVEVERVYLAPLLALAGLLGPRRQDGVHALVGDVAVCLATLRGGVVLALRSRRRDRSVGEAFRLRDEMQRLSAAAVNGHEPLGWIVTGSDGARLRGELGLGREAHGTLPRGVSPEEAEAGWLGGLLA